MFDGNILKWSWSQRFILLGCLISYWVIMFHPYAVINTETMTKEFSALINPFLHVSLICLVVASLYCYGLNRIKVEKFLLASVVAYALNLFYLVVGFTKDRRVPTVYYFIGIVCILVTCGIIMYDKSNYTYVER